MGNFIARNSRPRVAGLVLLSVVFVLLGLWLVGAFGPPPESRRYPAPIGAWAGWASLIFFGLCSIAWAKKLFDEQTQLEIGPSGIRWRPWSGLLIPWSEVSDITTWGLERQRFIVLHLRNPKRFPGRGLKAALAGVNRRLTGGDVCISLTGTDRGFDDAMAAVDRFRR